MYKPKRKDEQMTLAKIVYVTNTGNTEGISEILRMLLKKLVSTLNALKDDAEADFMKMDICVLATYTDGDGELPVWLRRFNMKNYRRRSIRKNLW